MVKQNDKVHLSAGSLLLLLLLLLIIIIIIIIRSKRIGITLVTNYVLFSYLFKYTSILPGFFFNMNLTFSPFDLPDVYKYSPKLLCWGVGLKDVERKDMVHFLIVNFNRNLMSVPVLEINVFSFGY